MTTLPPSVITVLAHPLRRKVLRLFLKDDARRPRSPVELAREAHAPVNDVAYHVSVLARNEALAPERTRPVRGATEHFYVCGRLIEKNEDLILALLGADAEADTRAEAEADEGAGT
jgi:hypothetical protein